MGIFARLSDIVSSNIHTLLDKVENPEAMIAQIIREMEDGIADAKRSAVTAITSERRLGRDVEQHRQQAVRWKQKAREALGAEREDLARRALTRKKEHDDLVHALEAQYAEALKVSDDVRTSLRALEARLAEARRKQRSLLARHRSCLARQRLQHTLGARVGDDCLPLAKFERLETRLDEFEDELAAQMEVDRELGGVTRQWSDLERDQAIEEELLALKRETGKE